MFKKNPAKNGFAVGLDVINTAAGILPINPIEGYTANGNIGDALLRTITPDIGMFFVDWATNRDYTGRPLAKENPFKNTAPRSQGAYASTPKALVEACQKLAEVTYGKVDLSPGVLRDAFKNYGGGFYKAAEDLSKLLYQDEERPRRWDDVPFLSGFTGHIDEDRSNAFVSSALYDYKNLSEGVVKTINAVCGTKDITESMVYSHPEELPKKGRVQVILSGDKYRLGKMYYEGMKDTPTGEYQYVNRQYKSGKKKGMWYTRKEEIKTPGVEKLREQWKEARALYVSLPDKTEEEKSAKAEAYLTMQDTWHKYYNAQADLVDALMETEYKHDKNKSASKWAYNAVKGLFE